MLLPLYKEKYMKNSYSLLGIKEVDFDNILDYEEIQDILTSDRFNTENILVIPTINGIELGLKVSFKNKEGRVCEDRQRLCGCAQ